MKKCVALFGGNLFQTILYNNEEYIPLYNSRINKLTIDYKVDNYQVNQKPLSYHYELIKKLANPNYTEIRLAVGDYESKLSKELLILTMNEFKEELLKIIAYAKALNVKVGIYLLNGNNLKEKLINKIFLELAERNNIEIYNRQVEVKFMNKKKILYSKKMVKL